MSTSLLYHAFGFKTYKHISTKYRHGIIYFHVKKKNDARHCTKCKSRDFVLFGPVERRWNHVPIGLKPIIQSNLCILDFQHKKTQRIIYEIKSKTAIILLQFFPLF